MSAPDDQPDPTGEWHRVHWFGLVELLIGAALGFALLLWIGLPSGLGAWAEKLLGALAGAQAFVAYFRRRYRITPTAVTTSSGVMFRSEESMRRVDIQSVSTSVPLWYRPLDLAKVVIKDGSGNKIEIGPLARVVAERFQRAMAPDGETVVAMGDDAIGTTAPAPDQTVRRVDIPLWKLIAVDAGDVGLVIAGVTLAVTAANRWWVAFASSALVWIGSVVFKVTADRRFQLTVDPGEIRTSINVLVDNEERTSRDRVEFFRVDETLVGRALGLERVTIGTGDDAITIAPVQRRGEWRQLAELVLSTQHDLEPPIETISPRSVPRFRLRGAALTVLVGIGASRFGWQLAAAASVATALVGIGWYPSARLRRFGLGGDANLLVARTGFFPRRRWLFPVDRIDSTERTATLGQRRARLATLAVSGRGPVSNMRVPDLDLATALEWDHLIASSIANRQEPRPAVGGRDTAPVDASRVDASRVDASRVGADSAEPSAAEPNPVPLTRYDQPLPPAALRFETFTTLVGAAVLAVVWGSFVGWAVATRSSDSIWRSPWLIGAGSAVLIGGTWAAVWLGRRHVRSQRWSIDETFVDRRAGVIVTTQTRVKFGHVAVARWSQGPIERQFGLGQVRLFTRGAANPDLILDQLDAADARHIAERQRTLPGDADATADSTRDSIGEPTRDRSPVHRSGDDPADASPG